MGIKHQLEFHSDPKNPTPGKADTKKIMSNALSRIQYLEAVIMRQVVHWGYVLPIGRKDKTMKIDLAHRIRKMSLNQLYSALYVDTVTQCLNRNAFELRHPHKAIAIVDLDSLKYINDTLGHRTGDKYLQNLAASLIQAFEFDKVYRLSGDELVVTSNSQRDLITKLYELSEVCPWFSFGAGGTLDHADAMLRKIKTLREEKGERAPRGERPPWLQR